LETIGGIFVSHNYVEETAQRDRKHVHQVEEQLDKSDTLPFASAA
jgi:hypothetical protein